MLTAPNLSGASGISHGFFTRKGGVSEGIFASLNCGPGSGDALKAVAENRRRCVAALSGDDRNCLLTLYQTHSPTAVRVQAPWPAGEAPRADGMATCVPGIALGILTADCAPVLMADEDAGVVGVAHAGWRGALMGIVESVVRAMEELGARRQRIAAAIGPCIAQPNYEVGQDFRAQFLEAQEDYARFFATGVRDARWQFDLRMFVAERLRHAGVENRDSLDLCTYADESGFFSFRRATHRGERDYGRQLSAILLR